MKISLQDGLIIFALSGVCWTVIIVGAVWCLA